MSDLSREDIEQFTHASRVLERAAAAIERMDAGTSATITQTTNPGGSLVIACAVLVGMNIVMSGVIGFLGMRVLDLDDKLSAIYMLAPHLNPEASHQ